MSNFTKTIMVKSLCTQIDGEQYPTISGAANYINSVGGGTIIVEEGTYQIDGSAGRETVQVPSNTTIIGCGNVKINVTANVPAFQNKHYNSTPYNDTNIVLSGFKIEVAVAENTYGTATNSVQVIDMKNVSNSVFEKLYITASPTQSSATNAALYFQGTDPGSGPEYSCANNIISQCVIKNFYVGIDFLNYCFSNFVRNNHVASCNTGFFTNLSENNIVHGNIFTAATSMNMSLGLSKFFIVHGNQINETSATTGSHGAYPSGCTGMILLGNVVYKNGQNWHKTPL